jgi:hypothetical protein
MTETFRIEEVKFMPDINKIIKDNFWLFPIDITNIELSTTDEDTKESFDLIYKSRIEISVRIRGNEYLKYCDFTIRNKSKYGGKTEIDKLMEGKGSLYLYAWKDVNDMILQSWILVDINKIRNDLLTNGCQRYNLDNTAFKAYSLMWIQAKNALLNFDNIPIL